MASNSIYWQCKLRKYHKTTQIRWKLNKELIDLFFNETALQKYLETDANNPLFNKCYQSDIYDEMWCLQFAPRSMENCVYLQLCVLPENVDKIKAQYT